MAKKQTKLSNVELLKWMIANKADAQLYVRGTLEPNGDLAPGAGLVVRMRSIAGNEVEHGLEFKLGAGDLAAFDKSDATPESIIGRELFRLQKTLEAARVA